MQEMQRRMLDVLEANVSLTDKLIANKTRQGQTPSLIQAYTYSTSWAALAPVDPTTNPPGTTNQVQTAGDSDFLIFYMSSQFYNHATDAALTNPKLRLQISDNASQRTMYSAPTFISLVTGNNGFPYLLQDSKLVPANTIILATLYNDMAVSAVTVDGSVLFGGFRIFYQ